MRCGGDFVTYQIWGAVSVYRERFCQVKIYQNFELIPKTTIFVTLESNHLMHFRLYGL